MAGHSVSIIAALNEMIHEARLDGRGLDAAALIAARDSVEREEALLAAISHHRFDSIHLASKGFPMRLADRMLYEEAGLDISADIGGEEGR